MSSWGTIYDNMMYGLRTQSHNLVRLQEQISSGMKVVRPSDGPSETFQIMDIQSQSRSMESYFDNLNRVTTSLEQASSVMQELNTSLTLVRERLTQAASGTYNQSQRTAMAEEINAILDQTVSMANTRVLGQYIFGGSSSDTAVPYAASYEDGRIVEVAYEGSYRNVNVAVSSGVRQTATLVGENIFRSDSRSEPVFHGDTGASAGVGTSTVRGDVWLTVVHDTTTYGGATGIDAGSRSGDDDTIIGASHTIRLDADTNRIRLDDGQFVGYTGGEVNLELTNASGDVVFVDMQNLTGGLSGTIDISINATGKLSIDDLETTVDLTAFSNNETVTSGTGRILYVNATGIERVGAEPVRVSGTYDLFGTLIGVRDMMLNERGLSEEEQVELLAEALDSLDEVASGLMSSMTSAGGRLQAMDTLKITMENMQYSLDSQKAILQDADIVEIAAELTRAQSFYEMILVATAKVLNLSLLDYL